MDPRRLRKLSPDEVLRHADRVESLAPPEMHPLIGVAGDDVDIIEDDPTSVLGNPPAPPRLPTMQAPRPMSTYCDGCGYVDSHAEDCIEQVRVDIARANRREEALERAAEGETTTGLLRRLGAAVLRRLAKRLEP